MPLGARKSGNRLEGKWVAGDLRGQDVGVRRSPATWDMSPPVGAALCRDFHRLGDRAERDRGVKPLLHFENVLVVEDRAPADRGRLNAPPYDLISEYGRLG